MNLSMYYGSAKTRLLAIWNIVTAKNFMCYTARNGKLSVNHFLWDSRANCRVILRHIADHIKTEQHKVDSFDWMEEEL